MRYYQRIILFYTGGWRKADTICEREAVAWSCIIISQVLESCLHFPALHRITGCSSDLAVLGGKRAASPLHDARGRHIAPPSLSIQQKAIKVVYRLENRAHPSWVHGIIPCNFCLYVGRHAAFLSNEPLNLAPPILAVQSTLANAAVLDHVPITSMCSIVLEKNQTSSTETGYHVAGIRPGYIVPHRALWLPSYHHRPQH